MNKSVTPQEQDFHLISSTSNNGVAPSNATLPKGSDPQFGEFVVVGVGASAGGLESLEKLFCNVPQDSGMAFVVVQHLSPDFKSMMDELLARKTQIPIHSVEENMEVKPNNIYLLPPKKEMIISGGRLHLTDKDPKQSFTLPIDHFFRSLAQDFRKHAVAIVLSGTGSDGSRGIQEIHKSGGLVLVEDPTTAKFDGMPLSAQNTGVVDLTMQAEDLAEALVEHADDPHKIKLRSKNVSELPLEGIEAVFDLLRRDYTIDFSHYKPTTVGRRIERRLVMLNIVDIDEYVARLREDDDELNALYKDLLIGVTQFFRDTEPFAMLERQIIPELLERVPPHEEIRVWSAACATGEEPYSLAILLYEALEKANRPINLKIFATDVHRTSLDHAGQGIYSEERLGELSTRRLKRFFTKKNDGYQVSQDLRKCVVFAQHNVIKDAPFTNLDLITCRNLLIYFLQPAQQKAISLFHFGLKTRGTLLLGSSESPGELSDEFETIDEHCKFYRKKRDIRLPADMRLPMSGRSSRKSNLGAPGSLGSRPDSGLIATYDLLLNEFMPPSFLIDKSRRLIDSFSGASKLLQVKDRRPSEDILEMLDTDDQASIAGALNRVIQQRQPLTFSGVKIRANDEVKNYKLSILPFQTKTKDESYLIRLDEMDIAPAPIETTSETQSLNVNRSEMSLSQVKHLEEELNYTKENLQATIEELETSNEEMQATNEEMVASNEELQSTNEELHSVNEELYTVNAEHQKKICELDELNQDMEHLFLNTEVATIFLDSELAIRKFTPGVESCFNLIESDVGRRIDTFSHRIQHRELLQDLNEVLSNGERREFAVRDVEGRSYFMRLLPYMTDNNIIDGVVLTLIDISVLEAARGQISRLSAIVESSNDAIISADMDGKIISWNAGAEKLYGYSSSEAIDKDIYMLVPNEQHEQVRSWFDRVRNEIPIPIVEVERLSQGNNKVQVSIAVSPIKDQFGNVVGVSSISRDVSQLKLAKRQVEQRDLRTRTIVDSSQEAIVSIDEQGKIIRWNPMATRVFEYNEEEAIGRQLTDLIIPSELREEHVKGMKHFLRTGESKIINNRLELEAIKKSGKVIPVELTVIGNKFDEGHEFTAFIRDITDRRAAIEQSRSDVERRDKFLAMLSHELRNPLSAVRTATRVLKGKHTDEASGEKFISVIDRQTAHIARLLDDLLEVSRITQDKIALETAHLDLRDTLDDSVQSVMSLANENEIEIIVKSTDESMLVLGDRTRLQQIQANLLTNGVKYSQAGQSVQISLSKEGEEAIIRVTDHGAGIPKHQIGKIFEMFYQSDDTLDRSHGGIGVGLSLVRSLAELHGGSISVQSDGIGKGSQFEVRLPLVQANEKIPKKPYSLRKPTVEIKTVVVVEDQEDNRVMISSMLEMEGFEVSSAENGVEGLKLIRSSKPDAAIIDLGLPELDGFEVARKLRFGSNEVEPSQSLLIALTGYGQPQDIEKAHECGFDHHMVKPLDPDRLLELLNASAMKQSKSS